MKKLINTIEIVRGTAKEVTTRANTLLKEGYFLMGSASVDGILCCLTMCKSGAK